MKKNNTLKFQSGLFEIHKTDGMFYITQWQDLEKRNFRFHWSGPSLALAKKELEIILKKVGK